jgi:tetratricopeptide (TPR) repeat protein
MFGTVFKNIDRTNASIALVVWLAVMTVYALTKAPTVSFWDCGEFIACSYTLGIPHPPGTPLYILVGRIFSIVPLVADICARVNLLSSVCSAFTAMLGYLVGVRILRMSMPGQGGRFSRFMVYGGAVSGALFLAFGLTQWNNSVEAEVYGMSMMLLLTVVWLMLVYYESAGGSLRDRLMILVVYLSFLGIGVHMGTFLVLPICSLLFMFRKDTPVVGWYLLGVFFCLELYLIYALSSRPGEIHFYIPVLIAFLAFVFYIFSQEKLPRVVLLIGGGFLLSLLPIIGTIKTLQSDSLVGALNTAAAAFFIATCLAAVLILWRTISSRRVEGNARTVTIVSSSIVLVAAFMTIVPAAGLSGYKLFLVMSIALTAGIGWFLRRHIRWLILIAIVGSSLVILGMKPFAIGLAVSAAVILIGGSVFKMPDWKSAFMILMAAAIGFSVHLYLPIRSSQDPYINQNDPSESLDATVNFLERKQYGTESMVERMFKRRSEWSNQFGNHRRMGFWGFFGDQWGLTGNNFFILIIIGAFGLWEVVRHRPKPGIFLVLLILVSSVGLVLYMNFADGTRINPSTGRDYLEVRDRDYFFTPAFVLFGLAIGLGSAFVLQYVRSLFNKSTPLIRNISLGMASAIFLLPGFALAGNYFECDRSRDYIPYNYARNLLGSADPNAVLFVAGDNDTFPLWCIQEVYGFRKDVKMVNLSLANLHWYVKQIRDYMGLELGWNDREIDNLRGIRYPDGRTLRLSDQVIDAIIFNNAQRIPINFSVTVGQNNRVIRGRSADSLLTMSGLKFRLDGPKPRMTIQVDETIEFYSDRERFRLDGLADSTIYKNETTFRTTNNYTTGFLVLVDTLRVEKRYAEAEELLSHAIEKIPYSVELVNNLAGIYAEQGKLAEMEQVIEETTIGNKRWLRTMMAAAQFQHGNTDRAVEILEELLAADQSYQRAFEELMRVLYQGKQYDQMTDVLARWVVHNPDDTAAARTLVLLREGDLLKQLQQQNENADTGS